MMELRKEQEIEHYDRLAREWQAKISVHPELASLDIEATDVIKMTSYQKLYELLGQYVAGKKVLDYGCGHGMHSIEIAKMGAREVIGIDLSEESLKIAEERVTQALSLKTHDREFLTTSVDFVRMDAEELEFPNDSFDIVFDGGTFSSIDLEKGLKEIRRVLKPGGMLIGIETLGHHPLANLKRWLNKKRGVRTSWAASHIMKVKDFDLVKRYLNPEEAYFFHFVSLLTIPFQKIPGGSALDKVADLTDTALFKIFPYLTKYAFKAVFIFSKRA